VDVAKTHEERGVAAGLPAAEVGDKAREEKRNSHERHSNTGKGVLVLDLAIFSLLADVVSVTGIEAVA